MERAEKVEEPSLSPSDHEDEDLEDIQSDPAKSTGSFNQLGGFYVNGKPLNIKLRVQIIHLASVGMRACDISKNLKVSHGCVSKIITRYKETGSINPGFIGGSKPKVATPEVVAKVADYRIRFPGIFGWEIRSKLIEDKICEEKSIPSISSINRIVRSLENRDHSFLAELGSPLSPLSFPNQDISNTISPPHHPMEHHFQSPKYLSHLSKQYTSPHKEAVTSYTSSISQYTSRYKSCPNKPAMHGSEVSKPPCRYSSLSKRHKANTTTAANRNISQTKQPHDSSSNSSYEENWSNSTQDSGVWSDLSDTYPNYPLCHPYKPSCKRKLSFSGVTDLSQPPVKRSLKNSATLQNTPTSSTKITRKRSRKSACIEDTGSITRSEKRANNKNSKSNVQVKQKYQMLPGCNAGMLSTQSLPTVTYSSIHSTQESVGYSSLTPSQDPNIFPSPPSHSIPLPDLLPIDSSSLLYPCSSVVDPASSWPDKDVGAPSLASSHYNTPSPPSFHTDIGYSTSNSTYSQNSNKIEASSQLSEHIHCGSMHPSYFYSQYQAADSHWNVTPSRLQPINPRYTSQDGRCQVQEPFKPLPMSSPPSYLSTRTRYPSPDSTSTHPFYTSTSLFQQAEEGIHSRALLPSMIDSTHSLPPVSLGELTHITSTVQSNYPILSPVKDSNSKKCPSINPINNEVLNDSPLSTCSYPLSLDTNQTIPTDSSSYYLSDVTHPFSSTLDDTIFPTPPSFQLSS
ncbi:Paired Domain (PRD) containing protein [Oopsacas minuta]|uniref:Paired Domain (PRD) containing protein n=1 Tax=Oopsacas minuta TaxID=111878 RepID=A0AAV7JAZ0_9METZ|nr:Paired Domain (PRD) containing protein [Oopsacas minuta]